MLSVAEKPFMMSAVLLNAIMVSIIMLMQWCPLAECSYSDCHLCWVLQLLGALCWVSLCWMSFYTECCGVMWRTWNLFYWSKIHWKSAAENCGCLGWYSHSYLQNSYKILTKFLQNSYKILTKFSQNSYKILTKFLQNSYKILTKFLQNSYKILTKFLWSLFGWMYHNTALS